MKKIGLFLVVVYALVFAPVAVLAYTSPGRPTGFVNDFAGVFDSRTKQALETDLSNFRSQTSNEIVVATVQTLDGDTIENYANELFREWGIGTKDKNNGVLILVAIQDKRSRIEVGYGLEGAIPDLLTGRITQAEMIPRFKQGDYAGGITAATQALKQAAQGEYNAPVTSSNNSLPNIGNILFWGFFVFSWLGSFLARSKSIWAGGIVGAMAGGLGFIIFGNTILKIGGFAFATFFGLFFDWIVSKNYRENVSKGGTGGFFGTHGGFSSGGSSGGGFGGFSGGSSGGGGSSGDW